MPAKSKKTKTSAKEAVSRPLCVDLDGTVLHSDTLYESFCVFIRNHPQRFFELVAQLFKNRVALKTFLATEVKLDVESLPYNEDVLRLIRGAKEAGRKVLLVSASHRNLVEPIADHLGVFDEVVATDGETNIKGQAKADLLVGRYGEGGFDYVGDSKADLKVWTVCHTAHVVRKNSLAEETRAGGGAKEVESVGTDGGFPLVALVKQMRVHQWVKNILVFVPLITAGRFFDLSALVPTIILFAAWSLVASGIYFANDLVDLEGDRAHDKKRERPMASGALPLSWGIALSPLLLVCGLGLGFVAGWSAGIVLLSYIVISQAYSLHLKRRLLVDVFCLAFLYTVRIVGGGEASGNSVTIWLLAFSSLLFLGLAFLKRCSELYLVRQKGRVHTGNRGYSIEDIPIMMMFGVASTFSATIVLSLYMNSNVASEIYTRPALLWILVPLTLFWQCRLWIATTRGEMEHDPIVFSAKDPVSWGIFFLGALCFVLSL